MKVELDIKMTKLLVHLADVKGELHVDLLAEAVSGGIVRSRLISGLRENGFSGVVVIDGEKIEL